MEYPQTTASLGQYRIQQLPPSAYYIPGFITPEEEKVLLEKINNVPITRWTQLSHRRLQTWPSALTKSNVLLTSSLPPWLTQVIVPRFNHLSIFESSPHKGPNHVLINEYLPNQGIMPHEDGAAYYPLVATVSLGAPIVFEVFEKDDDNPWLKKARWRILQEPRSLLVTTETMYRGVLHGIAERTMDDHLQRDTIANWDLLGDRSAFISGSFSRQTRVSLTYRDVLKTSKVGNSLKFLGKN